MSFRGGSAERLGQEGKKKGFNTKVTPEQVARAKQTIEGRDLVELDAAGA